MPGIYGLLNLNDTDRAFVNTVGQTAVYEAANAYLNAHASEMTRAYAAFIQEETESFKERYKLPGGGRLQRRGGQAQSAATKAGGAWDVAYPLEDFGAQITGDDVTLAYMRLDEFDRHLQTVTIQDLNTVRYELLRALFNDAQRTFVDPLHGALNVEPLANGDAVLYPPVLGSEAEAEEDHYLVSGYAASAISATNNPYLTLRDELEEHFGAMQGFGNVAAFIHPDQVAITEGLADFVPAEDIGVRTGSNTSVLRAESLPSVPGRVIGRVSGAWVVEWRWIPAGYLLAVDLDAPAPLKLRRDPADTGLQRGLHLKSTDAISPLEAAHYRHRFGVGVGNRLNGVVMQLTTNASYTIPAAYQ
jgi:hypothetical protein